MKDATCIFCRIVKGEIPCHKVFEDQDTLAFLDVGPLAEGHLLVIPKEHFARLDQIPAELAGRMLAHLPRLGRAVTQATKAKGFNVLQNNDEVAGQVVNHVHFHLIPRIEADGLGFRWNKSAKAADTIATMRDQIIAALGA